MRDESIKKLIIQSTKELIKEKGDVTIKDIADYTHVNIAAVNYHFSSKNNLVQIVISDIMTEFKSDILTKVKSYDQDLVDLEVFLTEILSLTYNFIFTHKGVIKYLFLNLNHQKDSAAQLFEVFFQDNEFLNVVYDSLSRYTKTDNPKELLIKYLMIFSSFMMPLFIELFESKQTNYQIDMIHDKDYKDIFIKKLINLIKS